MESVPTKNQISVTRKLQIGISILVVFSLMGSAISFYSQNKIETSYKEFKRLNETNALLNSFSTLMTNNTLGYMDAIVDKDSGTVDDEIVQKHEEFKVWVDKNKAQVSESLVYLDQKTDTNKFFQDIDLYWSNGRDMIGEIKQKKIDNLGQYDDVIDGKNEELKNFVIEKLNVGEQRFQVAAAHLESAQNLNHYVSLFSLFATLGFGVLISYFLIRNIKSTLELIGRDLTNGSMTVLNSSVEFSSLGTTIQQSSIKQASALQQTSSAIEEIKATVEKNTEFTEKSVEVTDSCTRSALKGKEASSDVISAINEIDKAQNETVEILSQTSQEIKEMVSLIESINQKTSIINDIVFQTKLLSFNASVEAARAGEHGKGFAVVAEEVGNLAQMSGNAASEINALLSSSVDKVNLIVNNTDKRINDINSKNKTLVDRSLQTSKQCDHFLNEINHNIESLKSMIQEINQASKEQLQGISSIADAMGNLDVITNENVTAADKCAVSAENLNKQSSALESSVHRLFISITGKSA